MAKVIISSEEGWSVGRNPWCVGFIDWLLKIGLIQEEEADAAYSILNPFKNWGSASETRVIYYLHEGEQLHGQILGAIGERYDSSRGIEEIDALLEKFLAIRVLVRFPEEGALDLSGCAKLWMHRLIDSRSNY